MTAGYRVGEESVRPIGPRRPRGRGRTPQHRSPRTAVVAVVLALGLVAPAGAVAEPEITDPCGVGAHTVDQQPLPWLDICAAWFDVEVVDEIPELTVTLQVGADLATRTDGSWGVSWRSGDCAFRVERHDDGDAEPGGLGGEAAVELALTCQRAEQVDCDLEMLEDLGFFCVQLPEEQRFDVSAGFAEDGDELSWHLRFEDDLAPYADLHRRGAVLTATSALTGANLAGASIYATSCQQDGDNPWRCRSHVGDWVPEGRDHHVR